MRARQAIAGADEASVAPLVALSLFALIGAGGIAFDYARLASLDTELQQAADQAALAAATQLDGTTGSRGRAVAVAQSLLANRTLFGNDGGGVAIATGQSTTDANNNTVARVTFYGSKSDAEADTNGFSASANGTGQTDAAANYVKVEVTGRQAVYAFTPIVGASNSGIINAAATAGLASAICKVPPLMICNPIPGQPFNADTLKGVGVQVTGHGNDRSGTSSSNTAWGPGDFGFLDVGSGKNSDLIYALASQTLNFNCFQPSGSNVTTGNPQGVYDAINTRFDIYDFSSGNGTTLSTCFSGNCPAASNVIKDVFKSDTSTNGNGCKLTSNNQGWHLLSGGAEFAPVAYNAAQTSTTRLDSTISGMGLPRDNCHYTSYNRACSLVNGTSGKAYQTNKYGDGNWARQDYWDTVHPGATKPTGWATMTRYQTYQYELANTVTTATGSGNDKQYKGPVCSSGSITPGTDRRVLSVAVVTNCASLSGSSKAAVIGDWVDMFLVEPTVDARGNGALKDSIYMEVIGKTHGTGTATQTAQTVRRDVPYLVR
ncbi:MULTISPECIES: pilus assembly protein TadG-related protein [Sphingomonas]|uniref:pilus assembly protein TadG-related protein n=1 Tax=Sphingomonas TaxID=13687 RepID=UPI000DEF2394|nr:MULTISPECIES: pilus assembly protein TadG-related protein [Sphingomonas]